MPTELVGSSEEENEEENEESEEEGVVVELGEGAGVENKAGARLCVNKIVELAVDKCELLEVEGGGVLGFA